MLEQPREPRFYPNEVMQEVKADKPREELSWYCTAHWLKCLYDDFLHKRIAGEQFPCSSCEKRNGCKSSPPFNFTPLMKKTGVKIKTVFMPGELPREDKNR